MREIIRAWESAAALSRTSDDPTVMIYLLFSVRINLFAFIVELYCFVLCAYDMSMYCMCVGYPFGYFAHMMLLLIY